MKRGVSLDLPCAVTGVGSLPFRDPIAAVAFVAEHAPLVPFCPELPRHRNKEGLLEAALAGWQRFFRPARRSGAWCISSRREAALRAALARDRSTHRGGIPSALPHLLRARRRGGLAQARVLKLQCVGPYSLAASIEGSQGSWLQTPQGLDLALELVTRLARARWECCAEVDLPVCLVFDEPCYGAAIDASQHALAHAAWKQLFSRLRDQRTFVGIHICSRVDATLCDEIDFDVLSCAAVQAQPQSQAALARFQARGGILICGAVPTWPVAETRNLPALSDLRAPWPHSDPARTWFSASCGLALLDARAARANFEHATALAERWTTLGPDPHAASAVPVRSAAPHPRVIAGAPWVAQALQLWGPPSGAELPYRVTFGGREQATALPETEWWIDADPHDRTSFERELWRLAHWSGRMEAAADWIRRWRAHINRTRFRDAETELTAFVAREQSFGRSPLPS